MYENEENGCVQQRNHLSALDYMDYIFRFRGIILSQFRSEDLFLLNAANGK